MQSDGTPIRVCVRISGLIWVNGVSFFAVLVPASVTIDTLNIELAFIIFLAGRMATMKAHATVYPRPFLPGRQH